MASPRLRDRPCSDLPAGVLGPTDRHLPRRRPLRAGQLRRRRPLRRRARTGQRAGALPGLPAASSARRGSRPHPLRRRVLAGRRAARDGCRPAVLDGAGCGQRRALRAGHPTARPDPGTGHGAVLRALHRCRVRRAHPAARVGGHHGAAAGPGDRSVAGCGRADRAWSLRGGRTAAGHLTGGQDLGCGGGARGRGLPGLPPRSATGPHRAAGVHRVLCSLVPAVLHRCPGTDVADGGGRAGQPASGDGVPDHATRRHPRLPGVGGGPGAGAPRGLRGRAS